MSCEKHTNNPKQILTENGGGFPPPMKKITIKDVKWKIANGIPFSDEDIIAINKSQKKDSLIINALRERVRFKGHHAVMLGNPGLPSDIQKPISWKNSSADQTLAHYLALSGVEFTADELIALGDPQDVRGNRVSFYVAQAGYKFSMDDLKKMGNPVCRNGNTVAHAMADNGKVFSVEELLSLGDPANQSEYRVSHAMARHGHKFSIEEIKALGNPISEIHDSIANIMIRHGHRYSMDEILELDVPETEEHGNSLANEAVSHQQIFSVEELSKLKNPRPTAYRMAKFNPEVTFTLEELIRLGDKQDRDGKTIFDVVKTRSKELKLEDRLLITDWNNPKRKLLHRIICQEEVAIEELLDYPELLERIT